ncbi:dynamin family protein [Rhodococcus aetherivorans]|uniref:dynamin family protein n=1 Tax=Rhodococcus aetherivorans TaxID=191292 RepID=UPI00366CA285
MNDDTGTFPGSAPVADPRLDPETVAVLEEALALLRATPPDGAERAALAHELFHTQGRIPAVVVVGEVKRGKSSLINALLQCPGLSPVDDDICTGTVLRFLPPGGDLDVGQAQVLFPDGTQQRIATSTLSEWISVGGHRYPPDEHGIPSVVDVCATSPLLPDIALIDTPGANGLDGAHGDLAVRAAGRSQILLFVCDAGTPLTGPELRFLAQAGERVEHVILVCSKIDLHPDWQDVLAADRRLLTDHLPRLARIPLLGVTALPGLPPGVSGLDRVVAALQHALVDRDRLQVINALRGVRSDLHHLHTRAGERLRMLTDATTDSELVQSAQSRIEELNDLSAQWMLLYDRDVARLRARTLKEFERALDAIVEKWKHNIERAQTRLANPKSRIPEQYATEITAELQVLLIDTTDRFVTDFDALVRNLYTSFDLEPDLGSGAFAALRELHTRDGFSDPRLLGGDVLLRGMEGSRSVLLMTGPLSALFGIVTAGFAIAYRILTKNRTNLTTWLTTVTGKLRVGVKEGLTTALNDAKADVAIPFRRELAERTKQAREAAEAAKRASGTTARKRQEALAALRTRVDALAEQLDALDGEIARLRREANSDVPA